MAVKISLEMCKNQDTIYTARAGLVPVNEVAKKIKLYKRINEACEGMRSEHKTTYDASTFVMFKVLGHLSGFHRVDQILKSSESGFLATLCGLEGSKPVGTTFTRFLGGTEDTHVKNMQQLNFDLATKNIIPTDGYHILVHDQSAIQKYGNNMEGVEKGYGGTLKKGSKMLQCSIVSDVGMHSILHMEVRPGSTYSSYDAANEIDYVLGNLPKQKRLILADSAYGIGAYMTKCEVNKSSFILAVKNDQWMKKEMETLDFKRYHRGVNDTEYGYREFFADRNAWIPEELQLNDDEWSGIRRIIVVKLPETSKETVKYQFLATNLDSDQHSAEEIHKLYRENRESIEQINDEIKNQLGLNDLSAQLLEANRINAQIITLAWNLQRHIEHVSMAEERKADAIRLGKIQNEAISKKAKRRNEWWTMFVRFISIGGKLRFGGNKTSVVVGFNEHLGRWIDALNSFDWKQYSLV